MSDLTITNAGTAVTANSAGSAISTGKRKIIRITPTLTAASAYADGDVLFEFTEIENAVKEAGGCSKLTHCYLIDNDKDTFGVDLFFMEKNTNQLGVRHASAGISADNFRANNLNGVLRHIQSVALSSDLDNVYVNKCMSLSDENESVEPILLQASSDSTSVYVSGVLNSGTPTFATSKLIQLVLHIEY